MLQSLGTCLISLVLLLALGVEAAPPANAGECGDRGGVVDNALIMSMTCTAGPTELMLQGAGSSTTTTKYVGYEWTPPCAFFSKRSLNSDIECMAARACPDPDDRLWNLWGRTQEGVWDPLGSRCRGAAPPSTPARAELTPALVLEALRRVGLPAAELRTQPARKTLVNFDTIFHTRTTTTRRTLTLLGHTIHVEAHPARYTWHAGDGHTRTTTSPGHQYPHHDVTHRYRRTHQSIQPSVDVAYLARYRTANGPWHDIPEPLTITGPPTHLRVVEGTPTLSGDYD